MAAPTPGAIVANYRHDLGHHRAFLQAALERLLALDPAALNRDGELYGIWQGAAEPKGAAGDWRPLARRIVAEFEGCRLLAYPDPGSGGEPWTIGYGHTGPEVTPGTTWTQQQADTALAADLERFYRELVELLPMLPSWPPHRQAALLSWAFNVGIGAARTSTLRQRLLRGDDPAVVAAEELPRWNRGLNGVLPGLARRRAAEVALFTGKPAAAPAPVQQASSVLLTVPYQFQNDNASGTGYRECFSSSCAMVAQFWGKVKSDDEYNRLRAKHGDSTSVDAQLATLRGLGLTAVFRSDGTAQKLEALLRARVPVPVGWLHQGAAEQASGGGHWSVVIGFDAEAFIHNDPNGEADMAAGGYVNRSATAGRGVRYSRARWLRRWQPGGSGGWYLDVRG